MPRTKIIVKILCQLRHTRTNVSIVIGKQLSRAGPCVEGGLV